MSISPIRPTDDTARALAKRLLDSARFAALGVLHPDNGLPWVSRVLIATSPDGDLITLVSDLALHAWALRANPAVSLLIGEPEAKGDPLAYPRMTVQATARLLVRDSDTCTAARAQFLHFHPKSRLYADFPDFNFVVFSPLSASLNGGFGKAFNLTQNDLKLS